VTRPAPSPDESGTRLFSHHAWPVHGRVRGVSPARRLLRGVGRNPNVGTALIVALGTAVIDVDDVAFAISCAGPSM
jgi:altronate dehydratase